tara:strand:+ start:7044 stop:7256 length:213 start_codon:yes stop_codon:yes gene_type:complete
MFGICFDIFIFFIAQLGFYDLGKTSPPILPFEGKSLIGVDFLISIKIMCKNNKVFPSKGIQTQYVHKFKV